MSTLALLIALARPPEPDLSRFPTHEEAQVLHKLAQEHYRAAVARAQMSPYHLREASWGEVKEREILCGYWYLLLQARDTNSYWRTTNLAELKGVLTHEEFASGRMPPPIPSWRYRYTD